MKNCTKCGDEITPHNLSFQNKSTGKLHSWCKYCLSNSQKARRKRDKEKDPVGFAQKERNHYLSRNREADRKSQYEWMARNPDRVFKQRLNQLYKITSEEYYQRLSNQDYKCDCCKQDFDSTQKEPCVDHDHTCCPGYKSCGKCIRGLLCRRCNVALGYFEKRPFLVDYIERTKIVKEKNECHQDTSTSP